MDAQIKQESRRLLKERESTEGADYHFRINIRFTSDTETLRLRMDGSGDQVADEESLATLKVTFESRTDFKGMNVKRIETTETILDWL